MLFLLTYYRKNQILFLLIPSLYHPKLSLLITILFQILIIYLTKQIKIYRLCIVVQEKIKFGPAQYVPFIFLCLVDMNDGSQLVLSSFLTPVIKYQWNLDSGSVSLLASIFYLGIFFGSIISGKLSDKHGRKSLIMIGTLLQLIFSTLFLFVNTLSFMTFMRFGYGFSFGFTIALTTSMYAESSPLKYRGKGLLLLNFCVSLGKIFGIILAYIFLDSFTEGRWKLMMFTSGLPSVLVLIGTYYFMQQSPRYLIANEKYDQAFQVINRMIKKNNKFPDFLTPKDKRQIVEWRNQLFMNKEPATIKSLFNLQYFVVTTALATCWFAINFNYYGQLTVLPFIFGKQHRSFSSYILTILGQAPSFFLSLYLVDRPNFGRKKSMMYFFFLSGCFHFIFALDRLIIISSISRFFMKQCFQMLYPCTTQSYGTLNRTLGFGFCSAIGRLGAFIMPYIILPLVQVNQTSIFIIFAFFGVLGAFSSYKIPKQPMNRPLDQKNNQIQMDNIKKVLI